jgi:hypothetical protein
MAVAVAAVVVVIVVVAVVVMMVVIVMMCHFFILCFLFYQYKGARIPGFEGASGSTVCDIVFIFFARTLGPLNPRILL